MTSPAWCSDQAGHINHNTMTEIRIPKGVSATIQDGGSCWVVRLSLDENMSSGPAQPCAEEVNEQPAEQAAPTASPVMGEDTADRKREQARRRKRRQRERERDMSRSGSVTLRDMSRKSVTESVTLRDIRPEKRDMSRKSVTGSVTKRDMSRSRSVTGQDCLIDSLTEDINNNIINKTPIKQTSVAKSVNKRDMSRSASVTPDETREDQQIYLDLDYQLPPAIDEPKAREAWQAWLRYRRDMGGCRRISMKALHEIFKMLEFYHKTGGERAVVQILEYSVERERLNALVAPRDVYRTPPPEPEPAEPEEEPIDPEDNAISTAMCREFLERMKRGQVKPVKQEEVMI